MTPTARSLLTLAIGLLTATLGACCHCASQPGATSPTTSKTAGASSCSGPITIVSIERKTYDPPRMLSRPLPEGEDLLAMKSGLEIVTDGHDFKLDRNVNEALYVGEIAPDDGRLDGGACRVRWSYYACGEGQCAGKELRAGFPSGELRDLATKVP